MASTFVIGPGRLRTCVWQVRLRLVGIGKYVCDWSGNALTVCQVRLRLVGTGKYGCGPRKF